MINIIIYFQYTEFKDNNNCITLSCYDNRGIDENPNPESSHHVDIERPSIELLRLIEIANEIREDMKEKQKADDIMNEWKLLALVLDRLFIIVFFFIGSGISVAVLIPPFFRTDDNYFDRIV